ncbi:hypothetical protein [Niveibacterium sp.]|uniref:hypothetical protein n=1 Tax=Niveibacterium sp. TaxID=2017444 RepID=UPI0035B4ED57
MAFEIATVPDVAGIRAIYDLDAALSDSDVADYAFQRQRATDGHDDLLPHLQRVVEISFACWGDDRLTVSSLAAANSAEGALIARFSQELTELGGTAACWGANQRQRPVLNLRSLIHASLISELTGRACAELRHPFAGIADLSQHLSAFAPDGGVPLHQLAQLLGAGRAQALTGAQVWDAWRSGAAASVTADCERRALASLRVLLRLRCLVGELDVAQMAVAEFAIGARTAQQS